MAFSIEAAAFEYADNLADCGASTTEHSTVEVARAENESPIEIKFPEFSTPELTLSESEPIDSDFLTGPIRPPLPSPSFLPGYYC
ncbi:hypothetical protein G7K_1802-t1 [Saitoella complicata NRRL Y-17804]|uniref:Uncharacterized protein n=1 Tax=Saitoella complicata (strain BCRC 22490 / CBS 7301 / JCM 7358 / NBRC 10748 / NRRL Y-17804) TaxID=698492 RepID=A0A0E9NCK8_SAICN|nr:hypothetical protein G7K_1802-t1 [Saitoella complicata NRRL Y-17804]